jgi:hypothetical protein
MPASSLVLSRFPSLVKSAVFTSSNCHNYYNNALNSTSLQQAAIPDDCDASSHFALLLLVDFSSFSLPLLVPWMTNAKVRK